MAKASSTSRRIGLVGLAVAGALAGSAGGAAAQYYYDEAPPLYPPAGIYGYGYGYGPRAAEPVSAYDIRRIAAEEYGFIRIDRLLRTQDAYIVDGLQASGRRQRLILDAFAGNLIRRLPLRSGELGPPPAIARVDPREEREPPRPRLVPKPPQRPAELRPPAEANAPATVIPPSPAAPPVPERVPDPPAPQPPAEAGAPATQVPPPATAPAPPSPGPADPESGTAKPRLVNPQDVRGTDAAERKPPLATPAPTAEAAVPLAPAQGQDAGPAQPKPETPIVPVAPLE